VTPTAREYPSACLPLTAPPSCPGRLGKTLNGSLARRGVGIGVHDATATTSEEHFASLSGAHSIVVNLRRLSGAQAHGALDSDHDLAEAQGIGWPRSLGAVCRDHYPEMAQDPEDGARLSSQGRCPWINLQAADFAIGRKPALRSGYLQESRDRGQPAFLRLHTRLRRRR